MPLLTEWNSFYVIVGSSAGALIGLQFVVLTLIAQRPHPRMAEAGSAFATPSVVHFAVVLMLAAVMSAPWRATSPVAVVWGLTGVGGILYAVVVTRRLRKQTLYRPVFEDWAFHCLLPLTAYSMLVLSGVIAIWRDRPGLFFVAAATLLLLFIGIHNAWDGVTYHVFVNIPPEGERAPSNSMESTEESSASNEQKNS